MVKLLLDSERACSLIVRRAPVAPDVLDSIPLGANILRFNGVVHSVVGDVPVDSEAPVMTS